MKATKGYIYEIDGKVYVNPELNPKSNPAEEKIQHYWNRLSKWESNNIEVVNAEAWDDKNTITIYHLEEYRGDQDHTDLCEDAQPCKHINGTVTELL